ncbi:adenosine deaminase [Flavobacteriaceae bacterium]|nr:adenosine deaminase [Flavobacteriaceae bacterium]
MNSLYNNLAKVELHVHLDCCLSYKALKRMNSEISFETFQKEFIGTSCSCLKDYIKCADKALEYMQTKEQLEIVVEDLFDQFKKDNVIYAEVRFAPLLHLNKGLSPKEVVKIISDKTIEMSDNSGIEVNLILCTLRHYSKKQSIETVDLIKDFAGDNIVGFDIAADEAGFPLDNHIEAFKLAKDSGIYCTAHAGEALGASSVLETLNKLRPSRIGHGVRSVENKSLLKELKTNNIHLELCLTSNMVTKVYKSLKDHPIDFLYQNDFSISINTDGRTIADTDLNNEYDILSTQFNWVKSNFLKVNIKSMEASFASSHTKTKIISLLKSSYNL